MKLTAAEAPKQVSESFYWYTNHFTFNWQDFEMRFLSKFKGSRNLKNVY